MSEPRVLILDDNVNSRRLLSKALDADPGLEVVGTSSLGEIGLEKLLHVRPDCVLLGLSSKGMETRLLQSLEEMNHLHPKLPILVVSSVAERGSPLAIESLSKGAAGFSFIPSMEPEANPAVLLETIRACVASKLKQIGTPCGDKARHAMPAPTCKPAPVSRRNGAIQAVVIGVSTGGPNVLAAILSELPASMPVPIFIVQHMPPSFIRSLAARLDSSCPLRVCEASEGAEPLPSTVWLAPGDRHMELIRHGNKVKITLTDAPPENSCRPAADVLFRSAAKVYGDSLLAVVLTGMGSDGLRGCREIKAAGGTIVVQDEATSVVWGMPGHVAEAGLAHEILPLQRIAAELTRRVGRASSASRTR